MSVEKRHAHTFGASRRWLSSERVAVSVLEELGYNVLETRKKVVVNETVVGEVDAIVDDGTGQLFAVEIKAGKIDISGIRQAYVNSVILGMKPLVICKGFADDAARELAEKLGVKIIQLSDIFLVESEELEIILREVVEDAVADYFEIFYGMPHNINPSYIGILKAVAETATIDEAAERLGMDIRTLMKRIDEMRNAGIIPRWAKRYVALKRIAQLFIQRQNIFKLMNDIANYHELLKSVEQQLNQLVQLLSTIQKQMDKIQQLPRQIST